MRMRIRNGKTAGRRVAAKLAAIKRAAGDEAEDVIDDVSDALDVEKDDVVEVVVDDPDGLVAELEVAGETELAGEVQEISLKVRQDYDGDEGNDDVGVDVDDEPREARRRAARRAARRRMAQASRGRGRKRSRTGSFKGAQAFLCDQVADTIDTIKLDAPYDDYDELSKAVDYAMDRECIYTYNIRALADYYDVLPSDGELVDLFWEQFYNDVWSNIDEDELIKGDDDEDDDELFREESRRTRRSARGGRYNGFGTVSSAYGRGRKRSSAGAGRRSKWAWSQNEFEPTSFGFELSDVVSATASSECGRGRNRKRSQAPRKNAAGSRKTLASMLRKAYSWDLLEDFAKAMGVDGDPDGKAQNTLDALANGQENVQDYVAFLREDGDEFKSKVADELLSEFGKADLAPEPGEQQAEPVIDVDDPGIEPAHDTADDAMPYGVDDPVEARRAAARKAAMRAAKARRSAKSSAKAPAPKGGVRVSRRSAVAGVAGQKPQEDNTTVDKSAFLFV